MVRASSSVEGTRPRAAGSRRVYRQSQPNAPLSSAPVKQIANFVAPFAALFALTFGIQCLIFCYFFIFYLFLVSLFEFDGSLVVCIVACVLFSL